MVRFMPDKGLEGVVGEVQTSLYEHALRVSGGKRIEAAKLLRVSRSARYRHLKKWEAKPKT